MKRIKQITVALPEYWRLKADACEHIEHFYKETDRVTAVQGRTAKEVYRTCASELEMSMGIKPK